MRSTTEIIEDHLVKRLHGQTEADIQANFDRGIVILSSFGAFHGYEGVRRSARLLQRMIGEAEFTYKHLLIEDDYVFLEWTAHSKDMQVCDGTDSFVVRRGRIAMQTVHFTPQPV